MVIGTNRIGVDVVLDRARQLGAVVVSVEYRPAPEHRSWRLSGSESCCQDPCSAACPERCWAHWSPAFAPPPARTDRVRGPGMRGRPAAGGR
ncbi:hypothetical protein SipoB123_34490 [Streptomyces ipomoeae]|nr:hypothetical protein SipoB123_34490 [Streptomyces ipomoeae]